MSTDKISGSSQDANVQPLQTYPKPNTTQGQYPYPGNLPPPSGHGSSLPHSQAGYGVPMQQYPPTYVPATQSNSQTTVVINQQPQLVSDVEIKIMNHTNPAAVGASIFFFFPLGIFALFATLQARNYLKQQKFDEAIKWGNIAKQSMKVCVTCTVLWIVAVAVLITWKNESVYYIDYYKNCNKPDSTICCF